MGRVDGDQYQYGRGSISTMVNLAVICSVPPPPQYPLWSYAGSGLSVGSVVLFGTRVGVSTAPFTNGGSAALDAQLAALPARVGEAAG